MAYEPFGALEQVKPRLRKTQISHAHYNQKKLESLASPEVAANIQILYGGSVNVENAESLLSQSEIDGALSEALAKKQTIFSNCCSRI
ncbi:MAG: hypothetical protein CM1200mP28_12700 [Deltaproteobacteria bacterium]|nr:MAG: hypothetical protein CM1200mP28_12700 [Deltaproteobacteria bacterium]